MQAGNTREAWIASRLDWAAKATLSSGRFFTSERVRFSLAAMAGSKLASAQNTYYVALDVGDSRMEIMRPASVRGRPRRRTGVLPPDAQEASPGGAE